MNARKLGLAKAQSPQPIEPFGMGFPRAERTNIETFQFQSLHQGRIVDSRIMAKDDQGREPVEAERRQCHFRPFSDDGHVWKALPRRKGGARIDDDNIDIDQFGEGGEHLGNMHRADRDKPQGRHLDTQNQSRPSCEISPPFALTQLAFDRPGHRIAGDFHCCYNPLLARGQIGQKHARAPGGTLGIQRCEKIEPHSSSLSR